MSSSTTYLASFNQRLPVLKDSPRPEYKSVTPSSQTTAKAVPPQVLLCLPTKSLEDVVALRFQQDKNLRARLGTRTIPTDIPEISLENEADVVEASAQYILAPIYEVLHELYPGKWIRFAECSSARLDNGGKGEKEPVRYDLVFQSAPQKGQGKKTIAVLEYKKRSMIEYNDFTEALLPGTANMKSIQERKTMAESYPEQTLLEPTALAYSKQVCKYAGKTRCQHVALFNWDNLLIFNFTHLGQAGASTTAGNQANLIWVNEVGTGGTFVNRCHIRKVLLGFLLKAFEDAGIKAR
ncbi:Nn.00g013860.m01.CDS01 [Neocucurbitaria sp. VM-36]